MANSSFFGIDVDMPTAADVAIVIVLTVLGGTMAGLLLCAFALDVNRLNAIAHGNNPREASAAKRVLRIVEPQHWLLITLLIWNDIALEMMPLVLHMFLNPFVAIVTSVFITLVFCEILPEALFMHHPFTICSYLAPFIYALMLISSPIAWPISKILDNVVGEKVGVYFKRRELSELIRYQDALLEQRRRSNEVERAHHVNGASRNGSGGDEREGEVENDEDEEDLTKEEMTIMLNVLSLSESTARSMLAIPIASVYRLHIDTIITVGIIETVFVNGYTYVTVYEDVSDTRNVTSVFLTNALLLLVYHNEEDTVRVRDLPLMPLTRFRGDKSGTKTFVDLQNLSPSIAAVTDETTGEVVGLITLRSVTEIVHETSFKPEMDPRNPTPMQIIVRSWQMLRHTSECATGRLSAVGEGSNIAAAGQQQCELHCKMSRGTLF